MFAVDVGYGQLLGSLRQDTRVVSLERTNVADVTPELLGTRPGVVVVDVTKLSLREVVRQLADHDVPGPGTELVGLVKPLFELGIGELPEGEELARALRLAEDGLVDAGWEHLGVDGVAHAGPPGRCRVLRPRPLAPLSKEIGARKIGIAREPMVLDRRL